jgi:hypothetical protein
MDKEELVSFEKCRSHFQWDGSWRDLYVRDTGRSDWNQLLDFLRQSDYKCDFSVNGSAAELPKDAAAIFAQREASGSSLVVEVSAVLLRCHFFTENEIEFDFDPRQVSGDETLSAVLCFMKEVGKRLNRKVDLTPENMPDSPIFSFDPELGMRFHN